jgi:probable addiction module antidote protein
MKSKKLILTFLKRISLTHEENRNDSLRRCGTSADTKEMAAYLEACFEEADSDAAFIAKALGDIARAKGMAQVARDAGLSRESLYKALSGERSPSFDTILKVIGALGLKLKAKAPQGRATVADRPSNEPREETDNAKEGFRFSLS